MMNAEQIVKSEVIYCVSSMVGQVRTLTEDSDIQGQISNLSLSPVDHETTARGNDWNTYEESKVWASHNPGKAMMLGRYVIDNDLVPTDKDGVYFQIQNNEIVDHDWLIDDWEELCESKDLDPEDHRNEVLEHWIVSDWLAGKLDAHGEIVDYDFMGLTVWGRTTSGQSISLDYVINEIAKG